MMVEPPSFNSRVFTVKLVGVRKFRNFMVIGDSSFQQKCSSKQRKNVIKTGQEFL